jgi:hypothetical protein
MDFKSFIIKLNICHVLEIIVSKNNQESNSKSIHWNLTYPAFFKSSVVYPAALKSAAVYLAAFKSAAVYLVVSSF